MIKSWHLVSGQERETTIKLRTLIEVLIPAIAVLIVLGVIKISWLRRLWSRVQLALWIYIALILILAAAMAVRQYLSS